MPGGRLTGEDRERIAAWLADGLGYAEIARRLGRPTSTVSREVGRNGGSREYRAEVAQRATRARAQRRGTSGAAGAPAGVPAAVDGYGRDPAATRDFTERFATLMTQTGLPRMAARVLACLVTTDSGALSAADLVQRLRVSHASVSKAVGYLERLDILRRERDTGQRRERYVIDDDVWLRSWITSARTNAMWADAARRGAEVFGAGTPAGARLVTMGRFFAQLAEDMTGGATTATADDALTVLAALVHAALDAGAAPLTVDDLAAGLGWAADRVGRALEVAEGCPEVSDPVVLRRVGRTGSGGYTVVARPDRLTGTRTGAPRGAVATP